MRCGRKNAEIIIFRRFVVESREQWFDDFPLIVAQIIDHEEQHFIFFNLAFYFFFEKRVTHHWFFVRMKPVFIVVLDEFGELNVRFFFLRLQQI